MNVIYLGFNSFKKHKRGVENVINSQSNSLDFNFIYYLHWGEKTKVYKNNKFVCISIKRCWYWPIILSSLVNRIKKRRKFIIHSHNALFSVFGFFTTDILTVHDGLYYQNKNFNNKKIIFWVIEKILYLRCSNVHFISNFTKEQSLFRKKNKFKIIYNSSHLEKLINEYEDLKVDSTCEYVLVVKSVEERARFDLLIEVALELTETNFIVAGKGPLLDYYRRYINDMDIKNISMLGYVDDVTLVKLYKKCKLVMNIAEYGEGFGLPIIEGYLFNKPVIASNKCAIPEVIISKTYLFENNVNSIIDTYQKALKSPTVNFNSFYKSKYSSEKINKDLSFLYSSI